MTSEHTPRPLSWSPLSSLASEGGALRRRHRPCRSPALSVNPRFLWPPVVVATCVPKLAGTAASSSRSSRALRRLGARHRESQSLRRQTCRGAARPRARRRNPLTSAMFLNEKRSPDAPNHARADVGTYFGPVSRATRGGNPIKPGLLSPQMCADVAISPHLGLAHPVI